VSGFWVFICLGSLASTQGLLAITQGSQSLTLGTKTLGTKAPITALAIAPDGKSIVAGSQAGIQILSYPDLKPDRNLQTELPNIHDLAFSPDGKTLAVAGGIPGKRGMVELFTWPDGKLLHRLKPQSDLIYSLAWQADSLAFATASADRTVCLIDAKSGTTTRTLEGHSRGVLAVAFLPGDRELISAGIDESVRMWNIKTGETVRTLANHTKPVHALALRPFNRDAPPMVVSISDDRTVRLWQPTVGRMVRFARLESIPHAAAWFDDSKAIIVACKDGHVRWLDPDTMEVTADRVGVDGIAYCLVIARDGGVVVGGQDGQIKRLDRAAPK
jgi:WD40 repeat protein